MSELIEVFVAPAQLLLDPNNPRLFDRPIERTNIPPEQIVTEATQERLLLEISKAKHGLDDLVYSIQAQGFVNLDTLLVKPLTGTNQYLVLEGNRRTAAIKKILKSDDVDKETKESLQKLAVKELKLEAGEDENEEVQKIISMRHLQKPRQWSPIARASAIYNNYMMQHRKLVGDTMKIISDRALARTSQIIGMKKPELKQAMGVFSIYKELSDGGFAVRAEHFSLLELLVKSRRMASEYFEFNANQLRTFDEGLEKINDFFIAEDRVVNNPQEFNKLKRIFTSGAPNDLDLIRVGAKGIDTILKDIKGRRKDSNFIDTLTTVKNLLEDLPVSAYKDTDGEAVAIMAVKRLIDKKFLPIAQAQLGIED